MTLPTAGGASVLALTGPHDQGWLQVGLLLLALALSTLIGFEREMRDKSAGLRTHAIIGVAAALIMEVSKLGFGDVLGQGIDLDPSRVAAQIVSGIGFIGAGLIFVRRDTVRGLTTAAVVWLTAAVGMACGSGLVVLAVVVTGLYLFIAFGLFPLEQRIPRTRHSTAHLEVRCHTALTPVDEVLSACGRAGFQVVQFQTERSGSTDEPGEGEAILTMATVELDLTGRQPITELASTVAGMRGVVHVSTSQTQPPMAEE